MSPAKKPARRPAPKGKPKKKTGGGAKQKRPQAAARGSGGKKPAKQKKPRVQQSQTPPAENPRAKALAQRIAQLVLDRKAGDVVILDVRGKASYADYMVIASGESDRQVAAMAEHVLTTLKHDGTQAIGSEGEDTGNWVLVDYGEVVAHLFFNEVRAFYDLEGLWADAPREQITDKVA